jgi:acyl homoserine lactone synthase
MLRHLCGSDRDTRPRRSDSMFRDRADEFVHRHGRAVAVDAQGRERDQDDDFDPLQVIREIPTGGAAARPVSCPPRGGRWGTNTSCR